MKLSDVSASQINNRNAIVANFRNLAGAYLNQMKVETKIYQKSTGKLVYEQTKEQMQMAPNSSFAYPLFLNGTALKSGNYQYQATVYGNEKSSNNDSEKYEYQWTFKDDFNIKATEAASLNQTDTMVSSDEKPNMLLIILSIVIIILLIFIAYLLIRKKINKHLQ